MRKLLLGSAVAVALLTGCGDDKKESSKTSGTAQEVKKEEVVNNNQSSTPATTPIKEDIKKMDEVKETSTTINHAKEKLIIAPNKVEGEIKEVTTQVVEDTSIDATVLYKTCGSCHGEKAEKAALGKSQVIAGWDKQRIIDAIYGYRNGTYGGIMKNIMAGHVNNKSDAEIEALAELISKM